MGNLGFAEIAVIAVVGLLVFGPQRLPEVARNVGGFVREFKNVTNGFTQELRMDVEKQTHRGEPEAKPANAGKESPSVRPAKQNAERDSFSYRSADQKDPRRIATEPDAPDEGIYPRGTPRSKVSGPPR